MDKCREEFEQSPKTKELLSDSIFFDEKENRYKVNADGCLISVVFLNGRWEVWQEQQAKVEEQAQEIANLKSLIQGHELRHQQNLSIKQKLTRRSEELEEEFAEDERFLKEQIKDKDLKISNLEYQQGMDKELIQTLQCKVEKLQKRVNSLEKAEFKLAQVKAILQNNPKLLESILVKKIEQALKGECKHESDGTNRLSLPPKTRCWKCGEFYSAHELKEGDQ
ncbi:hypothetical protein [Acinetobacter baumannii]